MQPRTKRQREVLDYITSFIEEKGYEPSYQQIARYFKIASKSAIAKHITALETQGLLSRQRENGSFGLQITSKIDLPATVFAIDWLGLPIGEISDSEWEIEPLIVSQFLIGNFSPEKIFAYRVNNDSMFEENFVEGDIVLVEKRTYARDGDIIVATIYNSKTALNKYYRHGANIELRPANDDFESLFVPADKVTIEGVVRGVLRPIP